MCLRGRRRLPVGARLVRATDPDATHVERRVVGGRCDGLRRPEPRAEDTRGHADHGLARPRRRLRLGLLQRRLPLRQGRRTKVRVSTRGASRMISRGVPGEFPTEGSVVAPKIRFFFQKLQI